MAEIEELADIDLATASEAFDHLPETLSQQESLLVEELVFTIMEFVNGLKYSKPFAKAVAKRLLTKLKQAELKEDSVGFIAEGVWRRLSGVGGIMEEGSDDCRLAELRIVEDILHKADEVDFFIRGLKQRILMSTGPDTSGKIIRAAARKSWPQIKAKLGI